MQPSKELITKIQKKFLHTMRLGIIAMLLVGAVFASPTTFKVQAAAAAAPCTNIDGTGLDWKDLATWTPSCDHVPTSTDDVVIKAGTEVVLTESESVHSLTIGTPVVPTLASFLTFSNPVTLSISGDLNYLADGSFDTTVGGTVQFVGTGDQTINTADQTIEFYNLKKVGGGQTLIFNTGANEVKINNNLTLRGTPTNNLVLRGTTPGTIWNIESAGTRDLNWLSVQDSNNVTSLSPVMSVVNWIDSAPQASQPSNTGWATEADLFSNLAVASLANASLINHPVTLTFHVYPSMAVGNVTFYEITTLIPVNQVVSGCVSLLLSDGAAGCTINNLSLGNHSFFAVFTSGDTNFTDSTSVTLVQTVNLGYFIPLIQK